jgi:cation diffusion facilitator family transporter
VDGIAADGQGRARLRAVAISLVVSVLLLAAKYQAYRLTGSTAILSDALESIVNVVAAVFAIGALIFAGRPADRNHPYGHGKMEFLSAAFEGGLIAFASLVILYEVVQSLIHGVEPVRR